MAGKLTEERKLLLSLPPAPTPLWDDVATTTARTLRCSLSEKKKKKAKEKEEEKAKRDLDTNSHHHYIHKRRKELESNPHKVRVRVPFAFVSALLNASNQHNTLLPPDAEKDSIPALFVHCDQRGSSRTAFDRSGTITIRRRKEREREREVVTHRKER